MFTTTSSLGFPLGQLPHSFTKTFAIFSVLTVSITWLIFSMKFHSVAWGAGLLGATAVSAAKAGLPVDKVYGVNVSFSRNSF